MKISKVTKVKLLAQETDPLDYTVYVFKVLNEDDRKRLETSYIMCTKWPNWNHRALKVGEVGYLEYEEHVAGKDSWFNGSGYTQYKYHSVQFNKFVNRQPDQKHEFKL